MTVRKLLYVSVSFFYNVQRVIKAESRKRVDKIGKSGSSAIGGQVGADHHHRQLTVKCNLYNSYFNSIEWRMGGTVA